MFSNSASQRRRAKIVGVAATVALAASAVAGCGESGDRSHAAREPLVGNAERKASPSAEMFRREQLTFVDTSRPTASPAGDVNVSERTLVTDIFVPDGDGPFPLIVWSHGFNSGPDRFSELFGTWARAGYVVAAPWFPLSSSRRGRENAVATDYVNQPGDVSFIIDEVLHAGRTSGALEGKVDATRIGVAGTSLGGLTTLGVTLNSCCRDRRIKAAVTAAAPSGVAFAGGSYEFASLPLLVVHGTADPLVPFSSGQRLYEDAKAPKYFLTFEGAGHVTPYTDAASPYDETFERITIAFWDAYLGRSAAALEKLQSIDVPSALGTFQGTA